MLAETCVFGKQLHGFFCCSPLVLQPIETPKLFTVSEGHLNSLKRVFFTAPDLAGKQLRIGCNTRGRTLSLSYGRCIAEFLDEESLVHLGLLALSTCVGLRYGRLVP